MRQDARTVMQDGVEHEINLIASALERFRSVLAKKAAVREFKAADEMCAYRLSLVYLKLKEMIDFYGCLNSERVRDSAKELINEIDSQLHRPNSYPGEGD